jgi:PleD family two-component response regulator
MGDPKVLPEITVLLVDEDHEYASTLIQFLRKQGFTRFKPAHANSISKAIEQLQSNSYQVILLDLTPLDGAGMAAFIEISSLVPDTPVVIMADRDDRNLALGLLREGAQDFLVKEEMDAELLGRALLFAIERNRIRLALQQQSLVDELTGLLNRRGFLSLARQQIKIAEREKWGLLLLCADL